MRLSLEGPSLESLTRRVAETPEDFLAEPRVRGTGEVHVAAVVRDLLSACGVVVDGRSLTAVTEPFAKSDRNHLAVVLVLCWLLFDDWFRSVRPGRAQVIELLTEGAEQLAQQTTVRQLIGDPERREEVARLALARLGWRPAGETEAQAQDRLTTLSLAERARVLRASRKAEERAREIREALARKAAEESADKWTRE